MRIFTDEQRIFGSILRGIKEQVGERTAQRLVIFFQTTNAGMTQCGLQPTGYVHSLSSAGQSDHALQVGDRQIIRQLDYLLREGKIAAVTNVFLEQEAHV